jgi:hypothetical protein
MTEPDDHVAPVRPIRNEPPGTAPAPVVPYDLDAEESLLGSMLLTRESTAAAVHAGIEPADFYKPAHGLIYDAILATHAAGERPDPVVVANRLGNPAIPMPTLLAIQSAAPASVNAPAYARIVGDTARRRRMMVAARDLETVARDGGDAAQSLARLTLLTTPTEPSAGLMPVELAPILAGEAPTATPTLWERTDGACLIYPGMVTAFQAEPSGAKTMLAIHACVERILAGQHVLYVDFEGDVGTIIERLRALGAPDDLILAHFGYIRPEGPFTATDRLALIDMAATRAAAIVVFDTLAAALALHGLNEDKAGEVLQFMQPVCRAIARTGSAVLVLDHVTKDKDTRGRWARGSGGKLGEVDAAYNIHTITGFDRKTNGHVRLKIAKDRYGGIGIEGEPVADIYLHPRDLGRHVNIRIAPPENVYSDNDTFLPTQAMLAVSLHLEALGVPASGKSIENTVTGYRATILRAAITALERLGHIRIERGGRAHLHHLLTPYRIPDTNPDTPPETDTQDPPVELDF